MKVFLLANNIVGLEVCKYLRAQGDQIVGLAIHEPDKQKYTQEIVKESGIAKDCIYLPEQLNDPKCQKQIAVLGAQIGISAFWGHILKKDFFSTFPMGCINFHPAYLPYNRGKNPNVWPIVEGTPAGVTIHYIDESVDGGDIIARRQIEVEPTDTGGSLYEKTLVEIVALFKDIWPAIKSGEAKPFSQKELEHTFHLGRQVDEIDRVDMGEKATAKSLIDRIRSRTYGNRSFAYFVDEKGRKVEIGVFLKYREGKDR